MPAANGESLPGGKISLVDLRGNLEPMTVEEMKQVYMKSDDSTLTVTYETFLRLFNINNQQLQAVRKVIWPFIRKTAFVADEPYGSMEQIKTGTEVKIYQLTWKPANNWYIANCLETLMGNPNFDFFRNTAINYEMRLWAVKEWIKKEIVAMKHSETMQDECTDHLVQIRLVGVQKAKPKAMKSDAAAAARATPAKKRKMNLPFSRCKVQLVVLGEKPVQIWGQRLCGSQDGTKARFVTLSALQEAAHEQLGGGQLSFEGFSNCFDEFVDGQLSGEITDDKSLQETLLRQHEAAQVGSQLKLLVKRA